VRTLLALRQALGHSQAMAARKRTWTPQIVRERIRTSMLIRRLHNHVVDPEHFPMSRTQVNAAQFLVSRVVGRAENDRNVNLSGNVTLTDLVSEALTGALTRSEPLSTEIEH
jgi:uncharacterized protein YecE (DUF72 family)